MITGALANDQALVRAGFRLILDVEHGIEVACAAEDASRQSAWRGNAGRMSCSWTSGCR
jgi:hypothetical protein